MKNSKFVLNCACFAGLLFFAGQGVVSAQETALTPEEKAKVVEAAKRSVEDEIKVFGSFEVDHPDSDELLKLTLSKVGREVKAEPDGTYVVSGDFKDEKGTVYGLDLYLEDIEGDYELADAILVTENGKPVGEEESAS